MNRIQLGRSGLSASQLGFGCSQIASLSTRHSRNEVCSTLLEALDSGVNFYDTADVYGQGDSERLLGRMFRNRRSDVIVCSKAGLTVGMSQALVRLVKPFIQPLARRVKKSRLQLERARRGLEEKCFDPEYLQRRVEGSLRRLGWEFIDIVMLHNPSPQIVQNGVALDKLSDLKDRGLVCAVGVSADEPESALLAMDHQAVSCVQIPYNVYTMDTMRPVVERAASRAIGLILREPFAAGRAFDHSSVKALSQSRTDASPARTALRHLLEQPVSGVLLAGMTCRRHLRENIAALPETGELDAAYFSPAAVEDADGRR